MKTANDWITEAYRLAKKDFDAADLPADSEYWPLIEEGFQRERCMFTVAAAVAEEREHIAVMLENRAARFPTDTIFNGKIICDELRANAHKIRNL